MAYIITLINLCLVSLFTEATTTYFCIIHCMPSVFITKKMKYENQLGYIYILGSGQTEIHCQAPQLNIKTHHVCTSPSWYHALYYNASTIVIS